MEKSKLIKFSKFYAKLDEIESNLRDLVDLGYYLDIDVKFLNKLDSSIENIQEYIKKNQVILRSNLQVASSLFLLINI